MTDADTRQWVKLVCEILGEDWETSHPGTVLGELRYVKEMADRYEGLRD